MVATPSAANSNARACTTIRCGNDDDRAIRSRALPLLVGHLQRGSNHHRHAATLTTLYFSDGPLAVDLARLTSAAPILIEVGLPSSALAFIEIGEEAAHGRPGSLATGGMVLVRTKGAGDRLWACCARSSVASITTWIDQT